MRKSRYYHYFVEGEDEEKLLKVLKTDLQLIAPGKVQRFNVVQEKLTKLRLMSLKEGTTVVLVFDTDTDEDAILKENIKFLESASGIKEVVCVMQVRNLEEELVRSTDVKKIKELTNSKSNSDFKRDLIKDAHFSQKLRCHKFDMKVLWSQTASGVFSDIKNGGDKIKI